MEISIQNGMEQSILRICVESMDQVSHVEEGMLRNSIPGLLPVTISYQDQTTVFSYEITRKRTLEEEIRKTELTDRWLFKRIHQMITILLETKKYLLEESSFMLVPEEIFLSDNGDQMWLCYLPGYGKEVPSQISNLLELLMKKIDYANQELVKHVYQLYSLTKEENVCYEQFLQPWKGQEKEERNPSTFLQEPWKSESQCMEQKMVSQCSMSKEPMERYDTPKPMMAGEKNKKLPVLPERVSQEQEVMEYAWYSYVVAVGSTIVAIVIIFLLLKMNLLWNPYTRKLDQAKFAGCILLCACLVGYVWYRMFQPKRKISKMKQTSMYLSYEGEEVGRQEMDSSEQTEPGREEASWKQTTASTYDRNRQEPEEEMPTQLLNSPQEDPQEMPTQLLSGLRIMLMRPELTIETEGKEGDAGNAKELIEREQILRIERAEGIIGSSKRADYMIPGASISRNHARIFFQQGQYWIQDLASTNGTYRNGEKLQAKEMTPLEEGDRVMFANRCYQIAYL